MFTSLVVHSNSQTELIDITADLQKRVQESKVNSGLCTVFIPHTTAAVTINENADPSVKRDILAELNKVIPLDDHYHHGEGNSAAHIKSTLIGTSLSIIIEKNSLQLGTWQGIFFCEFDGPRTRKVWIKTIPDKAEM